MLFGFFNLDRLENCLVFSATTQGIVSNSNHNFNGVFITDKLNYHLILIIYLATLSITK